MNNYPPLDKYGFPIGAPVSHGSVPQSQVPWQFGVNQKIQSKHIKLSQVVIKNPIDIGLAGTASASFNAGDTLNISSTMTLLPPKTNTVSFAQPYISIYQGTAADGRFQIFPQTGGSVTPGQYAVQGWYDWHLFANETPSGVNSVWSGDITNNSGSTQSIFLIIQWKILNFDSAGNKQS